MREWAGRYRRETHVGARVLHVRVNGLVGTCVKRTPVRAMRVCYLLNKKVCLFLCLLPGQEEPLCKPIPLTYFAEYTIRGLNFRGIYLTHRALTDTCMQKVQSKKFLLAHRISY